MGHAWGNVAGAAGAGAGAAGRPRPGLQWFRMLQRLFVEEPQAAQEWASPTLPALTAVPADGRCVLVVDDNPLNLMIASEMLWSLGLRNLQAGDGAEAVALACEVRLDLILMDLQMPVLDGLAATREIRRLERDHRRPRVPVVAYTSTAPNLKALQDLGFDDLLEKPCDGLMLQACVQRWCPPPSVRGTQCMAEEEAQHLAAGIRPLGVGVGPRRLAA